MARGGRDRPEPLKKILSPINRIPMDIQELKREVKDLLVEEGLGVVLKKLKSSLPENSKAYNDVVLLEADLKEANLKMVRGSISQTDLDVKYNQLRERLLSLIEGWEERDMEPPSSGKSSKYGSLLYQIPGQMEIGQETRCRVRIAYDEATLLENIELTRDTKVKDVRIAEVMEVELIDPAETPAFSIRTFNRQEQFIEKDEYTEWIFFVKPLREGQFPLLLRVSVIEKVGEKERVRDIVLEETVVIVAEPVEETGDFKATGYVVGEEAEEAAIAPVATASRQQRPVRSAALALVALIAFSGITYAAFPGIRTTLDWWYTSFVDTREAYQRFADRHPDSPQAVKALERLGVETPEEQETPLPFPEAFNSENPGSDTLASPANTSAAPLHSQKAKDPEISKENASSTQPLAKDPPPAIAQPKAQTVPAAYNPFVLVKGGAFTMGCTAEQGRDCDRDEAPVREVTVGDFYIGRTEVTNAEFCAFLNQKGNQVEDGVTWLSLENSYTKIEKKGEVYAPKPGFEKHPVVAVSWYGAKAYCDWMTATNPGRYRLPSEAEWEYAARGGLQADGGKYAGSQSVDQVAWYADNTGDDTRSVAGKKANALGIYDMSGNVWEWCGDWFGNYTSGTFDDPTGPGTGDNRVRRGGCWRDDPFACRVSNRSSSPPATRLDYVGFRIVRMP